MPTNITIERLDDGDGLEATMMRHHARWHKSCHLKFNQTQLKRLERKSVEEEKAVIEEEEGIEEEKEGIQEVGSESVMRTRSSHGRVDLKEASCFLCDEPAGTAGLHNASTYNINMKVRRCAMELEDTALLAKLHPVI